MTQIYEDSFQLFMEELEKTLPAPTGGRSQASYRTCLGVFLTSMGWDPSSLSGEDLVEVSLARGGYVADLFSEMAMRYLLDKIGHPKVAHLMLMLTDSFHQSGRAAWNAHTKKVRAVDHKERGAFMTRWAEETLKQRLTVAHELTEALISNPAMPLAWAASMVEWEAQGMAVPSPR